MTPPLQGRELDAKVAYAMGYRYSADYEVWASPSGNNWPGIAAYSTDFAALPEMLAWLTANGSFCTILGVYEEATNACASSPVAKSIHANGATLPEAVARLVVAVSQRAKEQP